MTMPSLRILVTPEERLLPVADDDPLTVALDPAYVVPQRIRWWTAKEPDRPFLREVGGRSASYGEMLTEIARWVTVLRRLGVAPGDRVLSMLASSIDAHALWLAAAWMHAVEVPVNTELRGPFLDHALSDPGAGLCFVRPEHSGVPRSSRTPGIEVVEVPRDGSLTAGEAPAELGPAPAPDDVSCVIYTSGTTGPSKGVLISWAQMSATIGRIPRTSFGEGDVVYSY